ncbi:MAG TPA: adenylate/guanylate cyclase domain-containing protein [Actinomycetota bacterium]|nr:adenylate/guanylate cyclase domain-containing protein [Actinomycetota bacterium]
MERPQVLYAKKGDAHIAYQIVGDGPVDIVLLPAWLSHLEGNWDTAFAPYLIGLSKFSRLIIVDQLGTGMSDKLTISSLPTLESWSDGMLAVLDAAGAERPTLLCFDAAGCAGVFFAATYPDRISSLILSNSFAKLGRTPDYPPGMPAPWKEMISSVMNSGWGTDSLLKFTAPTAAHDSEVTSSWARYERMIASPGDLSAVMNMIWELDVRPILPSISVPTRVIHSGANPYIRPDHGRYLHEHIPGSTLTLIDTPDHFFWFSAMDTVLADVEEFVTGRRPQPKSDRVLSTLLLTDITDSTGKVASLGDAKWRATLDRHDQSVRKAINDFDGRFVKHTGDGFLAMFDGPARAIRAAGAVNSQLQDQGLSIKTGLHSGEVELRGEDIAGIAVHVTARIMQEAAPGEIVVSRTVKDLVAGSGITFVEKGETSLRGIDEPWTLYSVAEIP